MQRMVVPISGISKKSEIRAAQDGECDILHNLTVSENGIEIIAPPTPGDEVESSTYKEFYHEKAKKWLYVDKGNVCLLTTTPKELYSGGNAEDLSFIGYIVIIYCKDGVRYAIYNCDDYRYLGKLPVLPEPNIMINPTYVMVHTDNDYYSELANVDDSEDASLKWENAAKGFFDECLNGLYAKKAFVDRTLIRIAARLFDGNYVSYSPVYYVEDSDDAIRLASDYLNGVYYDIYRDNKNFVSEPDEINGKKTRYYAAVRGFTIALNLNFDDTCFDKWENIIVAIDVFATPSIMGHECNNQEVAENKEYGTIKDGSVSVNVSETVTFDKYTEKSGTKIRQEVSTASLFYKIAEYDLKGTEVWSLENTSPTELALQKSLPINEQPHELYGAGYRYVFNGKLHVGGACEYLSDNYLNFECCGKSSDTVVQMSAITSFSALDGNKTIVDNIISPHLYVSDGCYYLAPMLHYPDSRARNMRLYVAYRNAFNEDVVKYRDFPLVAHDTLNIAYFLNEAYSGAGFFTSVSHTINGNRNPDVSIMEENGKDCFVAKLKEMGLSNIAGSYKFVFSIENILLGYWKYTISGNTGFCYLKDFGIKLVMNNVIAESETSFDYSGIAIGDCITVEVTEEQSFLAGIKPIKVGDEDWNDAINGEDITVAIDENDTLIGFTPCVSDDRTYTRGNVLRVSEVDNPFFFPVKSTYEFDGDIIAVCSNTVAVSQGQFGEHPLYVFTSSGVWLMSVDTSGSGTYLSQIPCSREICNNSSGVTGIPQGVVFPTSRGLMLIGGTEITNLSRILSGMATPELKTENGIIHKICGIIGKDTIMTAVDFSTYLRNSVVAYDYVANLLYVCNGGYEYIYVYNFATSSWSTSDGRYDSKIEYPGNPVLSCVYKTDNGYRYRRYTFENQFKHKDVPVLMVMRGCRFSTTSYKRISESALRGTFFSQKNGFYVMGSNDGVNWSLINGKEINVSESSVFRDLVCISQKSYAFKFISFAFAGTLRSDSKFLFVECMVETAFESKLR